MQRWLFLVGSVACFFSAWVLMLSAWPTPEPDLWTENSVLDIGELFQGQERRVRFELKNNFSQELEILEVIKGCACTESALTRTMLKPGETTFLQVVWRTGQARGRCGVNLGVVFKLSDDSKHHRVFRVEGDVIPDIHREPNVPTFEGTNRETKSVSLTPGRMATFKVKKVHCNHPGFTAMLLAQATVEITYDGKTPVRADGVEPKLLIDTDSPHEPQMVVPLKIRTLSTESK
jgi:hypothetical protein